MSLIAPAIMKLIQLLWLISTVAHAADPRHLTQRAEVRYPGVQFDSNGKFSISIFSDLHFGERE